MLRDLWLGACLHREKVSTFKNANQSVIKPFERLVANLNLYRALCLMCGALRLQIRDCSRTRCALLCMLHALCSVLSDRQASTCRTAPALKHAARGSPCVPSTCQTVRQLERGRQVQYHAQPGEVKAPCHYCYCSHARRHAGPLLSA